MLLLLFQLIFIQHCWDFVDPQKECILQIKWLLFRSIERWKFTVGINKKHILSQTLKSCCMGWGEIPFFLTTLVIIAELAERSPIIIQNNSYPSSQKNFDVRPYKVLLLTCMVNCTMGTPTPRLCSVVQWSVHWAPSQTTQVLVLARARHWDVREKKCELCFRLG